MRRAALAPAVAVVLLLAGCSGGGEEEAGSGAPEAADTSAPASDASPGNDTDGIPEDTLPDDELTPPAGEFSHEQREYLDDRVPVGVDPAAILQLGTEACDRIGYLERHDPDGLVAALREGEIPDAEAAIEHLCPEYADYWSQAQS
jgi:hypothetical protein